MISDRETLVHEIVRAQKAIFLEHQAAATPTWLDLDLTIGQIKAIFMLEARGSMTVGQAASELGIGKPAASILVDRLVQAGLVNRTEDSIDRRRAIVRLTAQGEELVTRLYQGRRELMIESLVRMRNEELEALLMGSRALASALSAGRLALRSARTNPEGISQG